MNLGMDILAVGFLSPALFGAGAAAVSIPIIIHLLNKRRFRTVIWAAMDFLLAAQRRNARRLRMQRWLLLAIRCLALLLLAAGMARLVVDARVFGGALGGQRLALVVWDDSYSMGYQHQPALSAFEKSKRLLADWIDALPPSDEVMVIRGSRGGVITGNKPTLDHASLASSIRAARLTDAGTDLAAAFDQAATVLADSRKTVSSQELFLLTDFSRSSLGGNAPGDDSPQRLKKAMANITASTKHLRILDLGAPDQGNMAVTDIVSKRPVVVAGATSEFAVTVLNATDRPQVDLPLTLQLDGVVVHTEKLGKIEAGATRTVLVEVTLPTAGRHVLEARLPTDFLPVDDARRLMLDVRREVPVLLVDGSPGDGKLTQGSATFLWAAYGLQVDGKLGSVFDPHRITELELPTVPLSDYAEVVLSDTAVPAPSEIQNLKKFVQAGGLLMIFPGNRTNAALMNEALGPQGAALLPASFGQPVRLQGSAEIARGIAFDPQGFTHPVLQPFGEAYKSGTDVGFLTVQTNQYFKLNVPTDGSVETILRYATGASGKTAGDAAVVAKQIGKGRVVLFASSADTSWNTFGAKPSFVPFIHELTYYALPRRTDRFTLAIGDPIDLPADVASPGEWTGPRNATVAVNAVMGKQGKMRLTSSPLTAAGLYAPTAGDTHPVVAVNPDPQEADIRHVSAAQFAGALGINPSDIAADPSVMEPKAVAAVADNAGAALGPSLIAAALALFLLEAGVAMAFSTYGR